MSSYNIVSPDMLELIGGGSVFAVPAINDNSRKIDTVQCSVAMFKTGEVIRPHTPVRLVKSGTSWAATANGETAIVGVSLGSTGKDGLVAVQIMGQAYVASQSLARNENVGQYLVAASSGAMSVSSGGGLVSNYCAIITAVPCPGMLEVLIGCRAKNATSAAAMYSPSGLAPYYRKRECTFSWHDEDDYFYVSGPNTLCAGMAGADKTATSWSTPLVASFLRGSVSCAVYGIDKGSRGHNTDSYDLRCEISGATLHLAMRSGYSGNWRELAAFTVHVEAGGYWA